MGNYCSSGQKKKDGDNLSQNSEEWVHFQIFQQFLHYHVFKLYIFFYNSSPSYKLASKIKNNENDSPYTSKEAPLVDPEPTSDISNLNAPNVAGTKNGNITASDDPVISGINNFHSSHGKPFASYCSLLYIFPR